MRQPSDPVSSDLASLLNESSLSHGVESPGFVTGEVVTLPRFSVVPTFTSCALRPKQVNTLLRHLRTCSVPSAGNTDASGICLSLTLTSWGSLFTWPSLFPSIAPNTEMSCQFFSLHALCSLSFIFLLTTVLGILLFVGLYIFSLEWKLQGAGFFSSSAPTPQNSGSPNL